MSCADCAVLSLVESQVLQTADEGTRVCDGSVGFLSARHCPPSSGEEAIDYRFGASEPYRIIRNQQPSCSKENKASRSVPTISSA
jgi:hypothetical protein